MASGGRRLGLVLAVLAACAVTLSYPIHGDVRHEVGVQAVSGHSAADTFSHRPLPYRLLVSWLARLADLGSATTASFELVLRVEAVALALIAAAVLGLGLHRHRPAVAFPLATVVFAATVLMSPSALLQPDWCALVLTEAGVGAALAGRRRLGPGLVGGALLAAAAVVKVVTLPVALLGLLAIALVDRRRAHLALGAAFLAGLGYLAAVAVWAPHEFGWMLDIRLLQPLPRPGPVQAALVGSYLANVVVVWPVVALLPAALVGLRPRHQLAAGTAAALAWAPVPIQDQFFPYQSPALPVVAAVAVLLALHRTRAGAAPAVFLLALTAWTGGLLATDPALPHRLPVGLTVAVAAGMTAGLWMVRTLRADRADPVATRPPGLLAALAVCLVFCANAHPWAAQSISLRGTEGFTPRERSVTTVAERDLAGALHTVVPAGTPVSYLAFGETVYFLRNPTDCRFPSPVFLQRSRYEHDHEGSRSWTETLGCLRDTPGEWLVRDPRWFSLSGQPREVIAVLESRFDCARAVRVQRLMVCPRRR